MVCWCDRVWRVSGVGAFRQVLAGFPLWKRLSLVRVRKCQRTLRGAMGCSLLGYLPHVGPEESSPAPASRTGDERNRTRPRKEKGPDGLRGAVGFHSVWGASPEGGTIPLGLGFWIERSMVSWCSRVRGVSGVGAIRRVPSGISTLRASFTCRSQKMPKTPRGLLWGVHPMADSTNPVRRGQVGRAMNETARHQGGSERGRAPPGPVG